VKAVLKNIDDYLALQPERSRIVLEKIRQTIRMTAPGVEEVISYGMPAFRLHGRMLVYFAGFKNHCSIFPGSKSIIQKMKTNLKLYKTSAGTISFTAEKPLPASLIKKIVKAKAKENLDKMKIKKT